MKSQMSLLILLFLNISVLTAQDITFEEVKEICTADVDRQDKIRVVVTSFKYRKHSSSHANLGPELATMLTNALYEVNCFRVLESASNIGEFDKEFDLGNDGYTNNNTAPSKGNMQGAQVIVTGEITEVAEGNKNVGVFGISVGKKKAHVGFILKVLDANTRDVLFSEAVNMEGKANGFNGMKAFGVKVAGSENHSKALNNALEKAIIKATEMLAMSKDKWGIEADAFYEDLFVYRVEIKNIDFGNLVAFQKRILLIPEVKKADLDMEGGIGAIAVATTVSESDLAISLLSEIGTQYRIVDVHNGIIGLEFIK